MDICCNPKINPKIILKLSLLKPVPASCKFELRKWSLLTILQCHLKIICLWGNWKRFYGSCLLSQYFTSLFKVHRSIPKREIPANCRTKSHIIDSSGIIKIYCLKKFSFTPKFSCSYSSFCLPPSHWMWGKWVSSNVKLSWLRSVHSLLWENQILFLHLLKVVKTKSYFSGTWLYGLSVAIQSEDTFYFC